MRFHREVEGSDFKLESTEEINYGTNSDHLYWMNIMKFNNDIH